MSVFLEIFICLSENRASSVGLHYGSPLAALAAVPAGALAVMLARVDVSDPIKCGISFKRNVWVGVLLLGGIGFCFFYLLEIFFSIF